MRRSNGASRFEIEPGIALLWLAYARDVPVGDPAEAEDRYRDMDPRSVASEFGLRWPLSDPELEVGYWAGVAQYARQQRDAAIVKAFQLAAGVRPPAPPHPTRTGIIYASGLTRRAVYFKVQAAARAAPGSDILGGAALDDT